MTKRRDQLGISSAHLTVADIMRASGLRHGVVGTVERVRIFEDASPTTPTETWGQMRQRLRNEFAGQMRERLGGRCDIHARHLSPGERCPQCVWRLENGSTIRFGGTD